MRHAGVQARHSSRKPRGGQGAPSHSGDKHSTGWGAQPKLQSWVLFFLEPRLTVWPWDSPWLSLGLRIHLGTWARQGAAPGPSPSGRTWLLTRGRASVSEASKLFRRWMWYRWGGSRRDNGTLTLGGGQRHSPLVGGQWNTHPKQGDSEGIAQAPPGCYRAPGSAPLLRGCPPAAPQVPCLLWPLT